MEIEYVNEHGEEYMRIINDERIRDNIIFEMLWHNKIAGFLPVNIGGIDEKRIFSYLVSGLTKLSDYIKENKLDENKLQTLLKSLCQTIMRGEEYLIEDCEILLLPECIYMDANGQVQLALFPNEKEGKIMSAKISEILETVMKYLNHAEKRQVFYIYELYRYCQEENFSIKHLVKRCEEREDRAQKEVQGVVEQPEISYPSYYIQDREENISSTGSGTIFHIIREKVENFFQKEKQINLSFIGEKDEKSFWLKSENGEEQIFLSKFPFLVGKLDNSVNGVLNHLEVSRIHGKFDWDGNQLLYVDLGSRNGTFVNGKRVVPYEAQPVKPGDELQFGYVNYHLFSQK